MVDGGQNLIETLGDGMQIFERQFTFLQLPVAEDVVDEPAHHALNPCGGWIAERPAGRLHDIRQHDQPRFLCLGLWTRIAVVVDVDRGKDCASPALDLLPRLQGFLVEE